MKNVPLFRQEIFISKPIWEEVLFITLKWHWIFVTGALLGGLIIVCAIYFIHYQIGLANALV